CLRLLKQDALRALSRACAKTGNRIAARMAMIAITTRSSISVKPNRSLRCRGENMGTSPFSRGRWSLVRAAAGAYLSSLLSPTRDRSAGAVFLGEGAGASIRWSGHTQDNGPSLLLAAVLPVVAPNETAVAPSAGRA